MNKAKFEIWKEYREIQFQVDLQDLEDSFASRGIGSSGFKNQAIERLKKRFSSDVAMEEKTMEDEESEKIEKKKERKNQIRTNRIMATVSILACAGTLGSFILAFPQFSKIQVQIDSLQASIDSIYKRYTVETYCIELEQSFKNDDLGSYLEITLRQAPVPNSVSLWEGGMSIAPSYFKVEGQILKFYTLFDPAGLKQICTENRDFHYTVTYIPL